MRAEWFAGLINPKLFDFGEKFRRHSRRGKKAEVAAAHFAGFILGGFGGKLRQRLAAGNAHGEGLDRFCLRCHVFRRRFGMSSEKDVRYAEARGLLEKINVRIVKLPACRIADSRLCGDLFLQPLESAKLARDFFAQRCKRETARTKSMRECSFVTKFSAVKREFVIESRGIDLLL